MAKLIALCTNCKPLVSMVHSLTVISSRTLIISVLGTVNVLGMQGYVHAENITIPPVITTPSAITVDNMPSVVIQQIITITPISPLASTPATNHADLARLLLAEFMLHRGQTMQGLALYRNEAMQSGHSQVFDRALKVSLQHEDTPASLSLAYQWQQRYPNHVPAWFYVAHLALKAQDYQLAGATLDQILTYDPEADLSEILTGIFPTDELAKEKLLLTLQALDMRGNPSLLVLQAGLLLQFNQVDLALDYVNQALNKSPDVVAFILLKADILKRIGAVEQVNQFLTEARRRLPQQKRLDLYHVRYLLSQNLQQDALVELKQMVEKYPDDNEIILLAGLVSIDMQDYIAANTFFIQLIAHPSYVDQGYYYLGISNERQDQLDKASYYYAKVMLPDLVFSARKKLSLIYLELQRINQALAVQQNLRLEFPEHVVKSLILEAKILASLGRASQALALLDQYQADHVDNIEYQFIRTKLMPDDDYVTKRAILTRLHQLDPDNQHVKTALADLDTAQRSPLSDTITNSNN